MSTITSLGLGSGIDVGKLVDDLVSSEREPVEAILDSKKEVFEARISAYGSVRSSFNAFQSRLFEFRTSTAFSARTASSSDDSLLTATATSIAKQGTYNIKVDQTAQAHSLASGTFDSVNSTVGSGTLTFKFGSTDYDGTTYNGFTQAEDSTTQTVTISPSNSTLSGVRDAINEAGIGVQATIVKVANNSYRLVLTSEETGAEQSMEITAQDADGNNLDGSGLSMLAFNADAQNMSQTQAALDAEFSVNGLEVTNASNTVNGAITGVTLNLLKADTAKTLTLNVGYDREGVKESITSMVSEYNKMVDAVSEFNRFDKTTGTSGVLFGDSTLRTMLSSVRSILSSQISGLTGAVSGLASLGITTRANDGANASATDEQLGEGEIRQLAGMMVLDEKVLDRMLESNFDDVAAVFSTVGQATDSNVTYVTSSSTTQEGSYLVNITRLATQASLQASSVLPADFSATPLTIDENNDEFTIRIDGVTSGVIEIGQGEYTSGVALASEIQSRINGDSNIRNAGVAATVSYDADNNRLVFGSTRYGSASKVEIVSADTNSAAQLGLTPAAGVDGVDVAGTIGGEVATGDGQELTGAGSKTGGLMLTIAGDTIGNRGTLKFTRGFAENLYSTIDQYIKSGGLIESKVSGFEDSLEDLEKSRERLDLRMEKTQQRLLIQFNAMDMLVSKFNSTGDFLTQQLDLLPGVTQWNK
jgi:flagellar hook-associated protein 2